MQHEIIDFKETVTNIKRRGYKIGNLAVCPINNVSKIFIISQRKLFFDVSFQDIDDAMKVAEWLNATFKEFFTLLDEYPNVDIVALTKWSVPDGIRIHETVQHMKKQDKPITLDTVSVGYKSAGQKVKEWTRQ